MKKLFSLFMLLCLLAYSTVATAQSADEVIVPTGIWEVGKDIPAGDWTIRAVEGAISHLIWCEKLIVAKADESGFICKETVISESHEHYQSIYTQTQISWNLTDGSYVIVKSGSVIFTPGKPTLGFASIQSTDDSASDILADEDAKEALEETSVSGSDNDIEIESEGAISDSQESIEESLVTPDPSEIPDNAPEPTEEPVATPEPTVEPTDGAHLQKVSSDDFIDRTKENFKVMEESLPFNRSVTKDGKEIEIALRKNSFIHITMKDDGK